MADFQRLLSFDLHIGQADQIAVRIFVHLFDPNSS